MSHSHEKPNIFGRLFVRFLRSIVHTPTGINLLSITKYLNKKDTDNWFDLKVINLELSRLPPEFDGYRLVQLSDFHIGTWLTIDKLGTVVTEINDMEADSLVFTGDFISHSPEIYMEAIAQALTTIKVKDTKAFILCNHDHWTDPQYIRSKLEKTGFIELSNDIFILTKGKACLLIAGVDDYMVEEDRLDRVLSQISDDGICCILLAHEPDFADQSSPTGIFDLQLSGHSHGGQIVLPLIGPIYLPRYARKYPAGLYRINGMYLYTNGGLGTAEIQFRLNTRPEITLFLLNSVRSTVKLDSF